MGVVPLFLPCRLESDDVGTVVGENELLFCIEARKSVKLARMSKSISLMSSRWRA
jgi:hypothetical protein